MHFNYLNNQYIIVTLDHFNRKFSIFVDLSVAKYLFKKKNSYMIFF